MAGKTAYAILRDNCVLHVAAVFRKALYAEDARGKLLCFLPDCMEPGPLHVLCPGWPDALQQMAIAGQEIQLAQAGGMGGDLADLAIWQPPAWARCHQQRLAASLSTFMRCIPHPDSPDLLSLTLPTEKQLRADDQLSAAVAAETRAGLADLTAWLARPESEDAMKALSLVGLGSGLTPSGDDILAGAFLALHALGKGRIALNLSAVLTPTINRRTNRISTAYLAEAFQGAGVQVFHACLNAILANDHERFPAILARISDIGHTSGRDTLLGILTVLRAHAA